MNRLSHFFEKNQRINANDRGMLRRCVNGRLLRSHGGFIAARKE
jgi:hypothetical protein